MGLIYVQIGDMNVSKVPKDYADAARSAMKDALGDAIRADKALTDKKGEGYTVSLSVSDMKIDGGSVSCKLSGEIVRFPKREMVSTSIKNGAQADGGPPDKLIAECVGAAADAMVKKIIPVLKAQARS